MKYTLALFLLLSATAQSQEPKALSLSGRIEPRATDPNSADSQFFIMFAPTPSLDNQYTIWGQVSSGMEFIDKIKKGDPARNGSVVNPDKIIKMQVAADAIKAGDKGK